MAATHNAYAYDHERQRRQQAQRRSSAAANMGYRVGYYDGAGDMRGRAQRQGRVGYTRGFGDGYDTRAYQEHRAMQSSYGRYNYGGGPRPVPRSQPRQSQQQQRGGYGARYNNPRPAPRGPPPQQRRRGNGLEDDPGRYQQLPAGMHYSQWHGRAETVASSEGGGSQRSRGNGNRRGGGSNRPRGR
ncbi:MAG: hypothetical protein Q9225_003441 [Loekoesia sp. 1 TL-2023]